MQLKVLMKDDSTLWKEKKKVKLPYAFLYCIKRIFFLVER